MGVPVRICPRGFVTNMLKRNSRRQANSVQPGRSKHVMWISCELAAKMSERIPVNRRDWSPMKEKIK